MEYGVKIDNGTYRNMVVSTTPVIVLDYIYTDSGSRSYQTQGRELYVMNMSFINQEHVPPSKISKSGDTITWSGVSEYQPFFVLLR